MAGKLRTVLGILFVGALLGNAACTGDTGPAGPPGKQGPKGDPGGGAGGAGASISAVLPSEVFLGRTVEITIIGSGTDFADGLKLDFGDGVTVKKAVVASPTSVVATIQIADSATQSTRDVTVGDDTYKGAFTVSAPIKVTTEIPVQQGGYVLATIDQLDLTTPFSADAAVAPPNGIVVTPIGASAYSLQAYIQADVLAPTGPVNLTVQDDVVNSSAPAAFSVVARSAKPITPGTEESGTVDSGSFTGLFEYTPGGSGTTVARITAGTSMSTDEGPAIYTLLPKSGKWADMIETNLDDFFELKNQDPLFIVTYDSQGAVSSPYGYTLDVAEFQNVASIDESEPNDTPVLANAAANGTITTGDITDGSDYFKIVVAGAPKSLDIVQLGDLATDIALTVYDTDGVTELDHQDQWPDAFGDPGKEHSHVDVTADGTYYVQVTQGLTYDPSSSAYEVFVSVQ